jgi:hypothetical protein
MRRSEMAESGIPEIGQRYGLSRENFILDPLEDTGCFAREDIKTQSIAESLEIDLVTGLAPKRLVWGPYGGGKTHTLMRTMRELEQLTPIHYVRIECPDLSKRSRFHDLYREGIMRALGQDFVIGLINEVVGSVPARRTEIIDRLKARFKDEEVTKAAVRIVDPTFDPLRLWAWISGVPLSKSELGDLGQTQDLTQTEAARLADIVCLLGRLLRETQNKTLVLVLDEMERLRHIGLETIGTFVSGFTRMVDPSQDSVSILIGASADLMSEMTEVFAENGPVASRLGAAALIPIPALDEPDVDMFIKGVIDYVRNPEAETTRLISEATATTDEQLKPDFFPFTREAVETLKSHLTQSMTPREITLGMTRALGRAYRTNRPAIDTNCVT